MTRSNRRLDKFVIVGSKPGVTWSYSHSRCVEEAQRLSAVRLLMSLAEAKAKNVFVVVGGSRQFGN
jgi:hypothetical protein